MVEAAPLANAGSVQVASTRLFVVIVGSAVLLRVREDVSVLIAVEDGADSEPKAESGVARVDRADIRDAAVLVGELGGGGVVVVVLVVRPVLWSGGRKVTAIVHGAR